LIEEEKPTEQLYLELLKKSILGEMWLDDVNYSPASPKLTNQLPKPVLDFLAENNLEILLRLDSVKDQSMRQHKRHFGWDWPLIAHSMIGRVRLDSLQSCMETVVRESVQGDFIETGVWRGGACIFMRGFLKVNRIVDRKVWVADSFEGLPEADMEQYPQDMGDMHHSYDFLNVSLEEVQRNFRHYRLLDDQVKFLKGWFKDTLPTAPIDRLAVARLDGDMYGSTMDSLKNLYSKVSPGGFIIIDDYKLPKCKRAVSDFRNAEGITSPMIQIDMDAVYWRKES